MTKEKFYNDTFEFSLTICFYKSNKDKHTKVVNKLMKSLGYKGRDARYDTILKAFAFVCEDYNDFYIFVDTARYKVSNKKEAIKAISVLSHECNHVKEFFLSFMGENKDLRDTECAMRISDWAFKKCMNTKYFKKMLK